MSNKQKLFEAEFAHQLNFQQGDLLEFQYLDPDTEQKWQMWSRCWDAVSGRFNRRINNLAELFGADERPVAK